MPSAQTVTVALYDRNQARTQGVEVHLDMPTPCRFVDGEGEGHGPARYRAGESRVVRSDLSTYDFAVRKLFSFPNPVNEASARLVASGVVLQAAAFLISRHGWVLIPLTFGFIARVLTGPKLSPLGRLVTQIITPRLSGEPRLVPGPPKRFAQGIGVVFTVGASIAWLAGNHTVAIALIAALTGAAFLESAFGICLGCIIFGQLMRWGIIPEDVCDACNDIRPRLAAAMAARASAAVG